MDFENHCKNCKRSVHCCIFKKGQGFAFVGIHDAKRIKRKTGKEFSQFLDYSPISKKIVAAIKNEEDYLESAMRYGLLDKENRILRLKIKHKGHCIFLNNERRCEIYDIRPNICRIYPFWSIRLLNGKLKIIEHDEQSGCGILKEIKKKSTNKNDIIFEKFLSKKQIRDIKSVTKKIEEENSYYLKNIGEFVKKNNIKK